MMKQFFLTSILLIATSGLTHLFFIDRIGKNCNISIQPTIYYLRTLFNDGFDPSIYHRMERGKSDAVIDFATYAADFEAGLRGCLDTIFAPDQPFTQTPTGKACVYCPFKNICGKN